MSTRKTALALCAALSLIFPAGTALVEGSARAEEPAQTIKRTPLQRFDVPGTAFETVIGIAEIAPNVDIGRHTHPGPESGYVLEGGFELLVDGQSPIMLKPGDSYAVPAATVHDARSGPEGARVIATYVVEKGKPLASPVE